MMFDPVTMKLNADPLILSALQEDITSGDVSANSVMPQGRLGEADLICTELPAAHERNCDVYAFGGSAFRRYENQAFRYEENVAE